VFAQTSDIRQNALRKFTEPSMELPCWWSSVLQQHGGWKIVETSGTYFGYLGD